MRIDRLNDTPGNVYRPRMIATLTVPLLGTRAQRINQEKSTDAIDLVVRPKRVRIESNDHNHADSATLTADWFEVGVDPRMLDNAVVQIFIANANAFGDWEPTEANCRFIGLVKDCSASRSTDGAAEVNFECVDYTSLFLVAKPFGSSGVPRISQRLDEAWRTIVSQTPGAEALTDRLVLEGLTTFPYLSEAVADRFKKLAHVTTKPETDAWAVWQQCVGMMGLLSYVKLDRVIVTTATNYYTESDAPILVWGKNIEEWGESRHSEMSRKGIGVTSYDALARTTIEAFFPPIGDERVKAKRAKAKKVLSESDTLNREDRDFFAFPGVTKLDALLKVAERIYEERSRQELEGHVKTREMFVESEDSEEKPDFDMMDLRAGDSVKVIVDPQNRQVLASFPSDQARVQFLQDRGYSEDAAHLIVANMKDFASLEAKFLVKSSAVEFDVSSQPGSFSVQFEYINRIQIDGSAVAE